jgi:predicted GIY-YIG superfamily endonuclease
VTVIVVIAALWLTGALIARAFRYRPRPAPVMAPSTRRRIRANMPHDLYRYEHVDRPGLPWYIGISVEPLARHRRHGRDEKDRWWYTQSTGEMIVIARFPNRAQALAAERAAIQSAVRHRIPLANTQHVPSWHRLRTTTR